MYVSFNQSVYEVRQSFTLVFLKLINSTWTDFSANPNLARKTVIAAPTRTFPPLKSDSV